MEMNASQYIVSARKYRPQTFDTIVGQEHVTNTLKNAILNQQIAQAYLFFGPRGVGKTTCARVFAKTINCLNLQPNGEACNECTSCKSFNSNTSFNIYELDAASNNSVEDIRQLIDQVRYPPQIGKYKVYIIDEVHMLSTAAFNAFLKTLEEPPPYAKFILATTEKNKVLPTILSRCQVFNFNRIKTEDIVRYLERIAAKENHQYEPEAIRIIAQKADGGLRDACSIYDQMAAFTQGNITTQAVIENLHVLDYNFYFQVTDAFLNKDFSTILTLLDHVLAKGFDAQNILVGMIDHLRYLLLAKDPQTIILLDLSDSAKNLILEQSKKCSEKFLLNALSLLNKADVNFRSSRHQRLHLEIHFLQIANLLQTITETEKKNITSDWDTNSVSSSNIPSTSVTSSSSTTRKIVKVSDKPLLNEVVVKTTASLKEINALLQSAHQQISVNVTEAKHEKKIDSSDITDNNNETQPVENYTATLTAKTDELKEQKQEYQINTDRKNEPTIHSSTTHTMTETKSITQKRYDYLLSKNPLIEELKIKLNIEFK